MVSLLHDVSRIWDGTNNKSVKHAYENAPKESRKRDRLREEAEEKIRFWNSKAPCNVLD